MPLGIVNEENISDSTRPDQGPAGMRLALDVGGSGIVLSIQRIELLVESMFRGDAGVDGTADGPDRRSLHDRAPASNRSSLSLRPKNPGRVPLVPVISNATLERLSYAWPFPGKAFTVTLTRFDL